MKKLSVIFSFRNEEENIDELVQRTINTLTKIKNWNYELIFVNDASTDNSLALLKDLQKKYVINIINMSRAFGSPSCVLAGFRNCSGDAIVYMDSDLQDPPELITKLIEEYNKGFDVVHTKRTKRIGESKIKLAITTLMYNLINFTSNIDLPKESGDFKLISRKALNHLNSIKEVDPYIRGLSVWVGFDQSFVEYVREPRSHGLTKQSLLFSTKPFHEFIRGITSHSAGPLYFTVLIGLTTVFFSIALIFYAFYLKITGLAVKGTTGIIISISFFSGIILTSIGTIGIYIARIYEQLKGRPPYIIKEIINSKLKK